MKCVYTEYHSVCVSSTNIGVCSVCRVTRYPSIRHSCLVRPLISALRFPGPLNPALTAPLVRADLGFPVLAQESLVARTEGRCPSSQPGTTTNTRSARVCAIISRAHSAAVEVFGTVSRCRGELSNHNPQRRRSKVVAGVASPLDVLRVAQLIFLRLGVNITIMKQACNYVLQRKIFGSDGCL